MCRNFSALSLASKYLCAVFKTKLLSASISFMIRLVWVTIALNSMSYFSRSFLNGIMQSEATFSASSAAPLAFESQSPLKAATSWPSMPVWNEMVEFAIACSLKEYSVSASTLFDKSWINSSMSFLRLTNWDRCASNSSIKGYSGPSLFPKVEEY